MSKYKVTVTDEEGNIISETKLNVKEPVKTGYERVKNGERYYYIQDNCYMVETLEPFRQCGEKNKSDRRYKSGNYFATRELAEKETERRSLDARMRRWAAEHNQGWEPDWDNNHEYKYYVAYYHANENRFETYRITALQNIFEIYFKTRELAEQAIEVFGDEIQEVIGVSEL